MDIYYNIYPLRGVAQLVARLLWEQDAVGSSPATPTKKTDADRQGGVGFSIGRDSNPERAKSVKKAAGGRFFSFLVRRRVPKCEAFGSSSSGDAQSAAPSRHSDHVGMGFAPFRFFFTEKSVIRAVIPPLSQKGTLGSPASAHNGSLPLPPFCELRLRRKYPDRVVSVFQLEGTRTLRGQKA